MSEECEVNCVITTSFITRSATWLKKRMAELGLRRRLCSQTPIALVFAAIKVHIHVHGPGGILCIMYRSRYRPLTACWGTEPCGDC